MRRGPLPTDTARPHSRPGAVRAALAATGRLGRLAVFGFEQLILSRLFERGRTSTSLAAALLHAKSIAKAPPELCVRDEDGGLVGPWTHGFSAVNAALFLNLRTPDALSPVRYARPAPAFRAIYLWDSAFIAQVWKWWDPSVAWDVLNAVLLARDGDRLQHMSSEFARSEFTQPPLIAWSLQRLADAVPAADHLKWVQEAYPALRAYHAWLRSHRRLPNGLYAWAHAYESGVENAPRFGERDERRLRDTTYIAAPDFSAYAALQCEALEAMARAIEAPDDAEAFAHERAALCEAIEKNLWREREGAYFDRATDGAFIASHSIATLLPLWAGAPDAHRAARLVDRIVDPGGYNTLIPLPSVAIDDPEFERDMWRGPVWVNMAFAMISALRRNGRHEIAADFAYRLCDGVYRTYAMNGHFYEFYDPTAFGIRDLHRKRGNRWKTVTLGKKPVVDFVGWTGLVNTLVIECLFGLRLSGDAMIMEPRFPRRAEHRRFILTLPLWEMSVDLTVLQRGAVRGVLKRKDRTQQFYAQFGETILIENGSDRRGEVA